MVVGSPVRTWLVTSMSVTVRLDADSLPSRTWPLTRRASALLRVALGTAHPGGFGRCPGWGGEVLDPRWGSLAVRGHDSFPSRGWISQTPEGAQLATPGVLAVAPFMDTFGW